MAIIIGKKWDQGAIYCGRGSALGNPFVMKDKSQAERNRVCDLYQEWFDEKVKEKDPAVMNQLRQIYRAAKKGDVVLGCFCAPKRCHTETIKRFIDGYL